MGSGWFLVVVLVCGPVGLQSEGDEDLGVLLQQLLARVEKLEEDTGQSDRQITDFLNALIWYPHDKDFRFTERLYSGKY